MKNKMYLCLIISVLRLLVIGCGTDYSTRSAKNNNTKNTNSSENTLSAVAAMCSNTPNPSLEGKTEETIETDVIDPYGYYKGMKYQKINVKDKTGKILSSFDPVAKTASRDEITQVNTKYCVGDQYHIKQNNWQINGKNLDTGVEFSIDLNQLLRQNVRQESKIALLGMLTRVQGEVLHDMSISVNSLKHNFDDHPELDPSASVLIDNPNYVVYMGGTYNDTNREVSIGNSGVSTHEIGHGVHDHKGQGKNLKLIPDQYEYPWATHEIVDKEAIGFEFYDTFIKEQKFNALPYELTGGHNYLYAKQNIYEMFAFCYSLIINGSNSTYNLETDFQDFPKMIEAFKKYLAQIRSLPIKERNPDRG